MSETTATNVQSDNGQVNQVQGLMVLLGVLGLGVLIWYFANQPAALDRSVLGTRGFAHYANDRYVAENPDKKSAQKFQFFEGRRWTKKDEISLRILPLYDPDIFSFSRRIQSTKDDLSSEIRSMGRRAFRRKIQNIPTLVVLPKWRYGSLRQERFHPEFLIDPADHKLPFRDSSKLGAPEVRHGADVFLTEQPKITGENVPPSLNISRDLTLYAPQTISGGFPSFDSCLSEIELKSETLLARCEWASSATQFWLLTDPDLLNNHGAWHGDNAAFVYDLALALAGEGKIIVDATQRDPIARNTNAERDNRNRLFSDLFRFFEYPFSYFWIALACLVMFTLWHAQRRYGAAEADKDSESRLPNKATVIDANVTILRATPGTDVPLAQQHIRQRMDGLGAEILGSSRKRGAEGEAQLLASISRKNKALGDKMQKTLSALDTQQLATGGSSGLFKNLNQFEKLIDEVRHEFGRSSNARS
jgi:hypothetical protein